MEYRRKGQQDTEDLLTIRLPPQPSLVLALFHRLCVCVCDYDGLSCSDSTLVFAVIFLIFLYPTFFKIHFRGVL